MPDRPAFALPTALARFEGALPDPPRRSLDRNNEQYDWRILAQGIHPSPAVLTRNQLCTAENVDVESKNDGRYFRVWYTDALPQNSTRTYKPERFVQRLQMVLRTGKAETYIRRSSALRHLRGPKAFKPERSNAHGRGHVDTAHCQGK